MSINTVILFRAKNFAMIFALLSSLLSFVSVPANAVVACAPQILASDGKIVLKFLSTTSCTWTVPTGINSLSLLVVGGGGGGGRDQGGGGGGGGLYFNLNKSVTSGSTVTVVVGAGGIGGGFADGDSALASDGNGSSFGSISVSGGGAGGSGDGAARSGGSGGGGGPSYSDAIKTGAAAIFTDDNMFGNSGGNGDIEVGGGGGGAGLAGGNGNNGVGGSGGIGKAISIPGITTTYFAGGGGGNGGYTGQAGEGGQGGGGAGVICGMDGYSGAPNTGGGGGGFRSCGEPFGGGAGGSGVVIVSYALPLQNPKVSFPPLPATISCGTGTYEIDDVAGEIKASNGGSCTGSVEIPEGVNVVGDSAFWQAQITSLSLPNSLTRIEASGIRSTLITSLIVPANVVSLGELAVASYGITSFSFAPDSQLTTIGQSAFQFLNISSITIPSSVTQMDASALETRVSNGTNTLTGLLSVRFEGNAPTIVGGSGLTGLLQNTKILVSPGATGFGGSSWSSTTIVTPPTSQPTGLSATKGPEQLTISFTPGTNTGSTITNYKYSLDNGATYIAFTPAVTTSPVVIRNLLGNPYTIRLKASNDAGDGPASAGVTETPDPPVAISVAAIAGVTAPVRGAIAATAVATGNGYTGTITWSPTLDNSRFANSTIYTATITLTPSSGFTLTGVSANFFTVSSATTVVNSQNSGVISAVFPATDSAPCYVVENGVLTDGSACTGAVVIEDGITGISEYAFEESSATSVFISSSVSDIATGAFADMPELREITVSNLNTDFAAESGVLFNHDKTTLILYPPAKTNSNYVVPSTVDTIVNGAFSDLKYLQIIEIPEGVTSIGGSTFVRARSLQAINVHVNSTNFASVDGVLLDKVEEKLIRYPISKVGTTYEVPPEIKVIDVGSISGVLNLETLILPITVTAIYNRAVTYNPSLTSVIIGDGVTTIEEYTFLGNSALTSISIGNNVTDINSRAFEMLESLTSVTFGSSVRTIGSQAFDGTSLVEVVLPSSLRTIEDLAFQNISSLTSVSLGNGIEIIGEEAFAGASLATLVIPASVVEIRDAAFAGNRNLRRVTVNACNDATRGLRLSNHFRGATNLNSIVYSGAICNFGPTTVVDTAPNEGILSIPSITFPYVRYGRSVSKTVTVKNVGTATFLPFGPIEFSPNALNKDYAFSTTCPDSALPANATCNVTVTFTPNLENINEFDGDPVGILRWRGYSSDTPIEQFIRVSYIDDAATYSITVSAGLNGNISPTTSTEIVEGSNTTYTITPDSGYQIDIVTVNSSNISAGSLSTVSGQTKSYTFTNINANNTISATFRLITTGSAPIFIAPVPISYLKTLSLPLIRFSEGKLICTPGTYNAGNTLDGVIQGSSTALFSPESFTYQLLLNGIAQTSMAVTTLNSSNSWNLPVTASGSLLTCSVAVSFNGITRIDRSSDDASGVSSGLSAQSSAIARANSEYSSTLNANSRTYQKALVENRAQWRKEIATIRTNYAATLTRINLAGSKSARSEKSAALKSMIAAQKKSAADYRASQPASLAAKNAADLAAVEARDISISKANEAYGKFIESIGYGVLIP